MPPKRTTKVDRPDPYYATKQQIEVCQYQTPTHNNFHNHPDPFPAPTTHFLPHHQWPSLVRSSGYDYINLGEGIMSILDDNVPGLTKIPFEPNSTRTVRQIQLCTGPHLNSRRIHVGMSVWSNYTVPNDDFWRGKDDEDDLVLLPQPSLPFIKPPSPTPNQSNPQYCPLPSHNPSVTTWDNEVQWANVINTSPFDLTNLVPFTTSPPTLTPTGKNVPPRPRLWALEVHFR